MKKTKIKLGKFQKLLIVIGVLILSAAMVSAARQPEVGQDRGYWGNILNLYLNVSHTQNGTLKKGLNASFVNINVTGAFGYSGVTNISTLYIMPGNTSWIWINQRDDNCSVANSCPAIVYETELGTYLNESDIDDRITKNLTLAQTYATNIETGLNSDILNNVSWLNTRITNNYTAATTFATNIETGLNSDINNNVTKLDSAIAKNMSTKLGNNTGAYFTTLGIGTDNTYAYTFTMEGGGNTAVNLSDVLYINRTAPKVTIIGNLSIGTSFGNTGLIYYNGSHLIFS